MFTHFRCLFACWLSLVLTVSACGQSGDSTLIRGQIVDYETALPIEGLLVCGKFGAPCTVTDANGFFALDLPASVDSFVVSGLGYSLRDEVATLRHTSVRFGLSQDPMQLAGCVVTGQLAPATNMSTPGSFGLLRRPFLLSGDQLSLQHSLNTLPGVTLDSRGYGGSQRIQIRGSFLRSPFAVRNVKMYLDGIPLSSPDGTAPLEMLDPSDIQSVEVVKGPAGSAWGSGTGGVLLVRAREAVPHRTIFSHEQMYGDFGLARFATSVSVGSPRSGLRVSHVYQENGGYRQQEFNRKQQILLSFRYRTSRNLKVAWHTLYYNGHWALPGGLTLEQSRLDPTLAIPFSVRNNASVYRERLWTGASAQWDLSPASTLLLTGYGTTTAKFNPYGTSSAFSGYKDEGADGGGGRLTWSRRDITVGSWKLETETGLESQLEHFRLTESANNGGNPGEHIYSYDTRYLSLMGFAALDAQWKNRIRVQAGTSAVNTDHRITALGADWSRADTLARTGVSLLPRLAASVRIDSLLWVHASVSSGNSNPTVFEQLDPSVTLTAPGKFPHSSLRSERGINYEVGMKGEPGAKGWTIELNAYLFLLDQAILPVEDSVLSGDGYVGFTRYVNSGAVRQQGIEALLRKSWLRDNAKIIQRFDAQLAFTRSDYRFERYAVSGESYNGKSLPGQALHSVSSACWLTGFNGRAEWSFQYFWFDRLPLNYSNTDWLNAWNLLNTRLSAVLWQHSSGYYVRAFAGVNNLLDTRYTSFPNLNDARERYYNPAPGRNYYAGIQFGSGR